MWDGMLKNLDAQTFIILITYKAIKLLSKFTEWLRDRAQASDILPHTCWTSYKYSYIFSQYNILFFFYYNIYFLNFFIIKNKGPYSLMYKRLPKVHNIIISLSPTYKEKE